MSDKLAEIIATKHLEVAALMPRAALLRAGALQRNDFGGFRAAIDRGPGRLGVIAEVKKASPSVGLIDPDFDPVRQAKRYLEGGASCLSILTDEKYFQGSLAYLSQISKFSDAPLLRKDFMIHEVQIHEAVVTGADAILLIVAALDDETLRRLYDEAKSFSLDVLVEVHDLREMERALELGADLIGVNNRNLKTFAVALRKNGSGFERRFGFPTADEGLAASVQRGASLHGAPLRTSRKLFFPGSPQGGRGREADRGEPHLVLRAAEYGRRAGGRRGREKNRRFSIS
jgi:indole-3-glycerol phosphate synthase